MNDLFEISERLIHEAPTSHKRYLYNQINWENRLIGIKGSRGTGKTTLVLQWLKSLQLPTNKAVYFSMDEIYFSSNKLVDTAKTFYQKGGRVLVLDEVHKYKGWSNEIKNLYDRYKDLKIVFTGSSIIDISRQEGDLSRRALMYELHGLSYREYLHMQDKLITEPLKLEQIISSKNLRTHFPADFKPLEYFDDYLKFGYYPFADEDRQGYFTRLRQLTRLIVEIDMAEITGFDIRNAKKMLQLLSIISTQVPFKPNLVKLSEKSNIHRNSVSNYLLFLAEARLINLLYPSGISTALLQKPEKIFFNNTNLLYALSGGNQEKGSERETFFLNQLSVGYQIHQSKYTDFEIDGRLHFEIGGINKGKKQIADIENSWIVKDDIEYPAGEALPLWIFGFLY